MLASVQIRSAGQLYKPEENLCFHLSFVFTMTTTTTAEKLRNLADCSSIELKVNSCKDLKAFNFFQKLSTYAVVSIFHDQMKKEEQQKHMQRQKTAVDRAGDGNPEWNHPVQFDTKNISLVEDFDHLFIKFDLWCECMFLGKRSLGKVRVPFTDLICEVNEAVQFMSYQVRTSDGKPNGVLNFSYKVIRKTNKGSSNVGVPDSHETDSSSEITNVSAYPSDKTVQSLYPTLEVQVQNLSRDISYPSLVEVTTPLPRISAPSPTFNDCHWGPEPYKMSLPSLLPFTLPAAVPPSVYCHPCQPLPFVQSPGTYRYPPEFAHYGNYGFRGNPDGIGQLAMVENNGHEGWKIISPRIRGDVLPGTNSGTSNGMM